jgi:hypothetical protein
MTENQQKIIDSLVAEFNSRNEAKAKRPFKLIDVDEFDAINQRHIELKADAQRAEEFWNEERDRYIDELIEKIREDIGDRICVERGDDATDNPNYSDYIYIYKHGTPMHLRWEYAFRIEFVIIQESVHDAITRDRYIHSKGIYLRTSIDRNYSKRYENEVELFNCSYTKDKLKDLLS